jgi:predicted metalloendopeptidase
MMVENLLTEFRIIVNESDWMDADSKQKAHEKVSYFNFYKKIFFFSCFYHLLM